MINFIKDFSIVSKDNVNLGIGWESFVDILRKIDETGNCRFTWNKAMLFGDKMDRSLHPNRLRIRSSKVSQ